MTVIHLLLYSWGLQDTDLKRINKERMRRLIPSKLAVMDKHSALVLVKADVKEFADNHWHNVHILGSTQCLKWVPESSIPFLLLFKIL